MFSTSLAIKPIIRGVSPNRRKFRDPDWRTNGFPISPHPRTNPATMASKSITCPKLNPELNVRLLRISKLARYPTKKSDYY
jgi:hypothetical protein